jgi:hypothetical protein
MDIASAFPGKNLKAADLAGKTKTLTIAGVAMQTVGDDRKPVMTFSDCDQGLVLNKTNSNTIMDIFGGDTDAWAGQRIELYQTKVQFGMEMVDAIRVQMVGEGEASPFAA